ncbi:MULTISPECIES: hypothetical protein [unclassified Moraxella]|uniref:hypothetical protein n=1 Tax=unclassified Moraxella TaxID=2685852 RepID=UPI003AF97803
MNHKPLSIQSKNFNILMDCTILNCKQDNNNLQIYCDFFDEANDKYVNFTLFINNCSKILEDNVLIDKFCTYLTEGSVGVYNISDNSLILVTEWVSYQPRESLVHVYEFFSDDIYITF